MTDSNDRDDEFLAETGTDVEKFLLQSADLDEGSALARQRVLRAVAEEAGNPRPSIGTREMLSWGIAAAAVAALAWTWTLQDQAQPQPQAFAEPNRIEASAPDSSPAGAVVPPSAPAVDPCAKAPVATGSEPRIDQIFKHDARIAEKDGRFGVWFAEHDGTGILQPAPGAEVAIESLSPATPSSAIHVSGSVFKKWGASVGLQLAGGGCYDGSIYRGIEFEARGPSRVNVLVQTVDVVPVSEGGTCEKGCWASHYKKIQLSGKFGRYQIKFADLVQHKFGAEVKFDPRRLRSIVFQVPAEDTPFDFAVSEVSFISE